MTVHIKLLQEGEYNRCIGLGPGEPKRCPRIFDELPLKMHTHMNFELSLPTPEALQNLS